jgi:hypothetical protein
MLDGDRRPKYGSAAITSRKHVCEGRSVSICTPNYTQVRVGRRLRREWEKAMIHGSPKIVMCPNLGRSLSGGGTSSFSKSPPVDVVGSVNSEAYH